MRYKIMKKTSESETAIPIAWFIDLYNRYVWHVVDSLNRQFKPGEFWACRWDKTTRKWERFYPPEAINHS